MKKISLIFGFFLFICVNKIKSQIQVGNVYIDTLTLKNNLYIPWDLSWGPDGYVWFCERNGLVKRLHPETGAVTTILNGIPDLWTNTPPPAESMSTGLFSMAIHPNFSTNPYVYLYYTHYPGSAKVKVVRYTYNSTLDSLVSPITLLNTIQGITTFHNSGRLVISPDLKLIFSTGDRSSQTASQDMNSLNGKILRMNLDGTIPSDNPIPGSYIYSWGIRHCQGLAYNPGQTKLYASEHGPNNDDEFNIIEPNRNYGWKNVMGICNTVSEQTFCTTYNVKEPIKYWTPTIAPCGIDFYNSDIIPNWKNSVLMATLKERDLRVLKFNVNGDSIISETLYYDYAQGFGRLRDVMVSPDGDIYVCTTNTDDNGSNYNPPPGIPKADDDRIIRIANIAPRALDAASLTPTSVSLNWKDRWIKETGFNVLRSTGNSSSTYSLIATLAPNSTSYIDNTVTNTQNYFYKITAFNSSITSSASNIDSVIYTTSTSNQSTVALVPNLIPNYPLKVSANKHYLTDNSNVPIFFNGDAAWEASINLTTQQMKQYFEDRRQKGFNTVYVELIEHFYSNQNPAWNNVYNQPPFTGTLTGGYLDFTTPNEAYWKIIDTLFQIAKSKNFIVLAFPAYCGVYHNSEGWGIEMVQNGDARMKTYGEFLGQRYANQPNIVWVAGGDAPAVDTYDLTSEYTKLQEGIKNYDTTHLWTAHTNWLQGNGSGIEGYGFLNLDFNSTYIYPPASSPNNVKFDYQRTPTIPTFYIEGYYENYFAATQLNLRYQEYQSILAGAFGQYYGNFPVWYFGSGWQNHLNDPGAEDVIHVGDLFRSRDFHLLVPDFNHNVVQTNFGTLTGGNYIGCGITSDSSTIIIYSPFNNAVAVNLNTLKGTNAKVWCYNPEDGSSTLLENTISSGIKTYSGTTGSDYVLVIDDAALNLAPPGTTPTPTTIACSAPITYWVADASTKKVNIIWQAPAPSANYNFRYRKLSTTTWINSTTNEHRISLIGLTPNTFYEFQVATNCTFGPAWGVLQTFKTSAATNTCGNGTLETSYTESANSTTLYWDFAVGASKYNIEYKPVTASVWSSTLINTPTVTLYGLQSNTTYNYRLRTKCNGVWTAWSAAKTFTTGNALLKESDVSTVNSMEMTESNINIYPNPSQDYFYLGISSQFNEKLEITIIDLFGKQLQCEKREVVVGENLLLLSVKDLAAGNYFVRVKGREINANRKLIIIEK